MANGLLRKAVRFGLELYFALTFGMLIFALLTSPTIYVALNAEPRSTGYVFLGVVGAGLFLGTHLLEQASTCSGSRTVFEQAGLFLGYVCVYNGVLCLTILFADAVGGVFTIVVAMWYPIYEFVSMERRNPLSLTGAVIYIAIGLDHTVITLRRFIQGLDPAAPIAWLLQPQDE